MNAYYPSYAPSRSSSVKGWLFSGLLFPACAFYLLNPGIFGVLDQVSADMYETGRHFSMSLGGNMSLLGGALGQLALPCLLTGFFYRFGFTFGLQASLFWLGQNLVNLSLQVAKPGILQTDMQGRLDWQQLLTGLNMAQYDVHVATLIFAIAIPCFIGAIAIPAKLRPFGHVFSFNR